MLKKAKLYSLLALIVTSTVVGLVGFSPTISAQSSVPEVFIPEGLPDSIEAKMLREGMVKCLMGSNYVRRAQISSGEWFGTKEGYDNANAAKMLNTYTFDSGKSDISDNDINVSHYAEPDDGRYKCYEGDGTEFVKKFIQLYGLGSPEKAACTLGFVPYYTVTVPGSPGFDAVEAIEDCLAPTKNNFVIPEPYTDVVYRYNKDADGARGIIDTAFKTSPNIDDKTYGSGYPGNRSLYALYVNAFFKACSDVDSGILTTDTFTGEDYYGPVDIVSAPTVVGDSATITKVLYKKRSSDSVHVRIKSDMKNEEMSCNDIVTQINTYSTDYKQWVEDEEYTQADSEVNLNLDPTSGVSTCRVDGIGWIICPVVNLMAGMVDSSYYLLDNSLLRTPAISLDTDAPLYEAWKLMRDFANIAFVLVFMIIIFSQITSVGISNYGIKQLLPKLIIAAILVNLSYLICAAAVDVSNLLGSELKEMLDNLSEDVAPDPNNSQYFGSASDGGGLSGLTGWVAISSSILIAGSVVGGPLAMLAILIPFLFAALGAVIATVLTLIIRQALVIILIFIAPLAFVALLLPNTEDYFKKWRKLFQSLLLLYPIIAIVFGGSALASTIIMGAAEAANDGSPIGEGLGGATQTLLQLAGAVVSIVPLFLVPTVIKLTGGALNRFAGIVNNPNKGPIDALRNRSMKGVERMQKNQASDALETGRRPGRRGRAADFLSGRSKYHRDADMKQEDTNRDRELALQEAGYNTSQALANNDLSGDPSPRQVREVAAAVRQRDELKEKERQATIAVLEELGISSGENHTLAMNGEVTVVDKDGNKKTYKGESLQEAASIRNFSVGGMKEKMATLQATQEGSGEGKEVLRASRARIVDEAVKAGVPKDAMQFASGNIDNLYQGTFEHDRDAIKNIKGNQFTSANVANGHSYAFKEAARAAMDANDEEAMKILTKVVVGIEANPNLSSLVNEEKQETLDKIKAWRPPENTTQQSNSTAPEQPPASINSGRPRDWSTDQPANISEPTQAESPTFTADQISQVASAMKDAVKDGMEDATGKMSNSLMNTASQMKEYGESVNTVAGSMESVSERVAKELKNATNQPDNGIEADRIKEAVSSGTAQAMQQSNNSQPTSQQPNTPPSVGGGRSRDWSGYSRPQSSDEPTQTESPTYRPDPNNPRK